MKPFNYINLNDLKYKYKAILLRLVLKLVILLILGMILVTGQVFFKGYERFIKIYRGDMMAIIENHQKNPDYVNLERIPKMLIDASLAVEDKRFYHHVGFDLRAIGRASLQNILSGEIVSGGSTITQQLSKNLFLTFEQTYERKVAELLLALALEEKLSKDEILELYLNVINYGDGQIGIYQASMHYFNKLPWDLTDSECVLLSGLPQGPVMYNLNENLESAYSRSDQVLLALVDARFIEAHHKSTLQNKIRKVRIHTCRNY